MRQASLWARLSWVLVVTTLLVAGVAGVWSYQTASSRARDLQDDVLTQVASLAASAGPGRLTTDTSPLTSTVADIDVAPLGETGLPPGTPPGLRTMTLDGDVARAALARAPDGTAVVATQPVAARDRIARDAALSAVLPLLVLIPLLTGAIILAVRRVLSPVGELAHEVSSRPPTDLRPVDETRAPVELRGFVTALNGQADRAAAAVAHERSFIAQAAHELRTPLAAMTVQLERARRASTPSGVEDRLRDLHAGMTRTRHLVEQLLALARAQADTDLRDHDEPFSAVLRGVVADVLPHADAAGMEISLERGPDEDCPVRSVVTASVLRNLLDNAITHADEGGVAVVAARRVGDELVVTVDDAGPGVADAEALLVPFVRGTDAGTGGSGLGLAIVTEQLRRCGGSLTLGPTPRFPVGTRAEVRLPLTAPEQ